MILHEYEPKTHGVQEFKLTPDQRMLLMPVGDVHAFSRGWPAQRFRDHMFWGVERGAYFLGMGEYFDFASGSQRKVMRELRAGTMDEVDEWRRERVEKFAELIAATRGRWLGLLEGHHFHEYQDGTTTDQHLCRLLGAPFLGTATLLTLRFVPQGVWRKGKRCEVIVFAHHGPNASAGRKQGARLHRLEDMITGVEADIYLMGHDHSKANAPMDRLYVSPNTRGPKHLYHRTKALIRTGGFLRGYFGQSAKALDRPAIQSRGSYVEQGAMTPSSLGGVVISIGIKRLREGAADVVVPDIHYSV